jgi:hypothetical protein
MPAHRWSDVMIDGARVATIIDVDEAGAETLVRLGVAQWEPA